VPIAIGHKEFTFTEGVYSAEVNLPGTLKKFLLITSKGVN